MKFYALIPFFLISNLQARDFLVRPKANFSGALSYSSTANFEVDRVSESQLNQIDLQNFETEEVVAFSGDDVILNPPPSGSNGNDPLSSNQWALFSDEASLAQYGAVDIDARRAWEITRGSNQVVVYVMDSGIDARDPDLAGRLTSSYDAFHPGQAVVDENGHGTHVSSILAAQGDNNYGIKGVVPGDVQLAMGRFLNASNQGDSDTALRVVRWMKDDMRARRRANPDVLFVSSNSWGGESRSSFLEDAMKELEEFDVVFVTSAGNHGRDNDATPYFPCSFNLIGNICVGASDRSDLKTSFSGYGKSSVQLLAPGDQIYGIVPGNLNGGSFHSAYDTKRGTSQAVPHVAGVAALVRAANPRLSATDVRQVILASADQLPGYGALVESGGRLNAFRAVLMATGQDPSQADRKGLKASSKSGGGCSLSIEATKLPSLAASYIMFSLLLLLASIGVLFVVRRSSRINR